jgi:hypothetical protein
MKFSGKSFTSGFILCYLLKKSRISIEITMSSQSRNVFSLEDVLLSSYDIASSSGGLGLPG